ncbi:MAG: hypothetical protein ACR2P5_05460 [Gammaproteobacteria bacterium]
MTRYRSVPRQYWEDEEDCEREAHRTIQVVEGDAEFTGLLDADGYPIYRVPDPIGFRIRK